MTGQLSIEVGGRAADVSALAVTALIVRAQSGDTATKKSGAAFSLADRFKELDKNNDEKLSREELGSALFEFLNANRDDSVTLDEARALAGWMCDVLDHIEDEAVIARVRGQVTELCGRHPVYAA